MSRSVSTDVGLNDTFFCERGDDAAPDGEGGGRVGVAGSDCVRLSTDSDGDFGSLLKLSYIGLLKLVGA